MGTLVTRLVRDAADLEVAVTGNLEDGERFEQLIVCPAEFKEKPVAVRINGIFRAIESGLMLLLYWEGDEDHNLILPLEGYGVLDLERFGGLQNPRKAGFTGNILLVTERHSEGKKSFALSLEMSKERS